MLNVKVESIDRVLLEWTGELRLVRVVRTKRIPQEVGEPDGNRVILKLFIGSITSKREHDSLAIFLAEWNVLPNLVTAAEQLRAVVGIAITLIAEIRARPVTHSLWEDIDKTKVDNINVSLLTEMAQALLVSTLTLIRKVSG